MNHKRKKSGQMKLSERILRHALTLIAALLCTTTVLAQTNVKISGIVTDRHGEPLIGASVGVKGTTNATMTGIDGDYSLTVPSDAILTATYIGYITKDVPSAGKTLLNIVLNEDARVLDEVVVTALGIKKKEKSLTYSTQQMGNEDITRVKDPNMINALAGKTAGVQINRSSSGLGGSSKVVIRGGRSLSGNNQPLYVIDGMPISNTSGEQPVTTLGGKNDGGARDAGDGIANLNPDDIESMSILKGPAAAALYGSEAANGVILITTRKGKSGTTKVDFSSNLFLDYATQKPDLQKTYNGEWGEKLSGKGTNFVDDFLKTGSTFTNSLSLSAGNDKMQTYFSYANMNGTGIVPGNTMMRHNLNFRESAKFFNDVLSLDANVSLINQTVKNRPVAGGYYLNPLVGLYRFPQGQNMSDYQGKNMEVFDPSRDLYVQNWSRLSASEQNPYWLTEKTPSNDKRNRAISSLTANVKITDWVSVQARGSVDFTADKFYQQMYAGTHEAIAKGGNGRYSKFDVEQMISYGDFMASFSPKINETLSLQATVGASIKDEVYKRSRMDSNNGGLLIPNLFVTSNMFPRGGTIETSYDHTQMQSLFGTAQVAFNDYLFLDMSARNDWSSTLAFSENVSFFYPSIGLTAVVSDMIALPNWVSFGKVRGAWSQVGNTVPIYSPLPYGRMYINGDVLASDEAPFRNLEPEKTTSLELGFEWRFFNNRIDIDFTYYKTNTKNQYFVVPAISGAEDPFFGVNGGNIENKGVEIVLGGSPVMTNDFTWKTSFNYSINKNKIIELHENLPTFIFGNKTPTGNYQMLVKEGGSIGDIYGTVFQRDDQGKIQYDEESGLPLKTSDLHRVGNSTPKYNLGWSNSFLYKDFTLSFLIDMRVGGDVFSMTQSDLDYFGASQNIADARDRGYVMLEGKKIEDVKGFYQKVVASDSKFGVTEFYKYSATNIRMRELSFGYSVNKKFIQKLKIVKNAEIALVARNLFFFKNNAPFDPDAILSTDNNLQGIDVFGMPSTRNFGFNLKVGF